MMRQFKVWESVYHEEPRRLMLWDSANHPYDYFYGCYRCVALLTERKLCTAL